MGFFSPNVSVQDDDVLFLNGCELKAIVDFTGVCRFAGDPGDKSTSLVKNLAELSAAQETPAPPPSDQTGAIKKESPTEQFKKLYRDSLRFAVEPKYDFCGGTVNTYPGYAKDNCLDEGGYTMEKSFLGILTKDTVPLCISTSAPLGTALKDENLPNCIRQVFKEQEVRLQQSGDVISEANQAKLKEFGALCEEAMVPYYDENLGQYVLKYPVYWTNNPLTGEAAFPMTVSLEWACGTALTALFTESDYKTVGKVSSEPSQSWPWGMPPEPKKPQGVKDLETCFSKNLGKLEWNKWVEINKFCVQTIDERPWAYAFAAIGGTAITAVAAVLVRHLFKLAAFILSKKMIDAVIDKSFWAADGLGGLGKRIKNRFKKFGEDVSRRWREAREKRAASRAPKEEPPKMVAVDPNLVPVLLPTPALQPSMKPSPVTTALPPELFKTGTPITEKLPALEPIQPKPVTLDPKPIVETVVATGVAYGLWEILKNLAITASTKAAPVVVRANPAASIIIMMTGEGMIDNFGKSVDCGIFDSDDPKCANWRLEQKRRRMMDNML